MSEENNVEKSDVGRYSSKNKMKIVLEHIKGESLDALSRKHKIAAHLISEWHEKFLNGGQSNLKTAVSADHRDDEIRRLKEKLGDLMFSTSSNHPTFSNLDFPYKFESTNTRRCRVDMEVLKKRISTYRGDGGRVRITDDGLLMEILAAWEQWTGSAKGFYPAIGVSQKGMASIIGKAKKLRREGHFPVEEFKEIKVVAQATTAGSLAPCGGLEIVWDNGKLIRFSEVDQLVDFLKKVA